MAVLLLGPTKSWLTRPSMMRSEMMIRRRLSRADSVAELIGPLTKHGAPGCAVAVSKNGRTVYRGGFGLADLEHRVPVTPATVFHVASVSKQFTAFMAALLDQEGALSLDASIRDYVPEVPDFGRRVTLRHLVHHTSGLRDQWMLLLLAGWRIDDVMTTADILGLVGRQRQLNFAPGAHHLYSNTGYTLLAVAAERVTGRTFRDLCQARIFEPLGMKHTHFHDDHREVVRGRADSYVAAPGGGFRRAPLGYSTVGATSLFTTAEDLLKWETNLRSGQVGGRGLVRRMVKPGALTDGTALNYGFGLMTGRHRGIRMVQHSGGDAGYRAHLVSLPSHRLAVTLLANHGGLDASALALRVADVFLEPSGDAESPAASTPKALASGEAALLDGVYVNEMSGVSTRVVGNEGGVAIQVSDAVRIPLRSLGKRRFQFASTSLASISFQPDQAGAAATAMRLELPGVLPSVMSRRAAPPPRQLADFVGDYRSEELDAVYHVAVAAGELVLKRPKYPPTVLRPTCPDAFAGPTEIAGIAGLRLDLRFKRTRGGIAGFRLSADRCWNVEFARQVPSSAGTRTRSAR
ncbi:MAG: serine hydrolase domain-containing protein [Candidatus Dormibacteria bacterium]